MRSSPLLTGSSSTSTVRPKSPRSFGHGHIHTQAEAQQQLLKNSVRTHLADLLPLPRHALFHVKLTIHQLWNVPLVSGRFSVRWKFQNVQSVRGNGLKARMLGSSAAASASNLVAKRKGRVVSGESMESNGTGSESLVPSEGSSRSSLPNDGSSSNTPSPLFKTAFLPATENGEVLEFSHDSRGRTEYVGLRDHNVKWGQTINVLVQMDVQRDTKELQPSQLKLVVEQLVIPGDPDAPQNPRLGAVYLNLAEYADEGPVTRRYLLRQSKINATLQLTLELTHIGGEKTYKSPPLRKGEVMAGVASLLENSPYSSLPHPTSLSRRPSSGPAFNLDGVAPGVSRPSSPRSRAHSPIPPESLRTTDNIIEAIFNPVPTSSTTPSPFTYYVPPKPHLPALDLSRVNGIQIEEEGRPPSAVSGSGSTSASASQSFSISTRSEQSHASASVSASVSVSMMALGEKPAAAAARQRWWRKFGGHCRQEQQQQRPAAAAAASNSRQSQNSSSNANESGSKGEGDSCPNSPVPPPSSQSQSQPPSIMVPSLPPSSSSHSKSSGESQSQSPNQGQSQSQSRSQSYDDHRNGINDDNNERDSSEQDGPTMTGTRTKTRTRLVSGNEQAGAPYVFLRRPTAVGGKRPSDVSSARSRGS